MNALINWKHRIEVYTTNARKGGDAKTTTTFEGADYLASKGYRVLLIDCDKSRSLTFRYILEHQEAAMISSENTIEGLFFGKNPTPIEVRHNISLIAGLSSIDSMLADIEKGRGALRLLIWFAQNKAELTEKYDFILIDTHNDDNIIVQNAMVLSDKIIVPIGVDGDSMRNAKEVEEQLEWLKSEMVNIETGQSMVNAQVIKVGAKVDTDKNDREAAQFKKAFEQAMEIDDSYLGWFRNSKFIRAAKLKNQPLSYFKNQAVYANNPTTRVVFEETDALFEKIFGV
jgi:chromosome partitioning protein